MTERMMQVPVSLIERLGTVQDDLRRRGRVYDVLDEVVALLPQPTPSIEDMAAGTTFHASAFGVPGVDHHFRVTGERAKDGEAILQCFTHEFGALSSYVDQSTIHDVQPPKEKTDE